MPRSFHPVTNNVPATELQMVGPRSLDDLRTAQRAVALRVRRDIAHCLQDESFVSQGCHFAKLSQTQFQDGGYVRFRGAGEKNF